MGPLFSRIILAVYRVKDWSGAKVTRNRGRLYAATRRASAPPERDLLARRVNPVFVAMLLHAPFQAIDTDGRGTIDLDEFLAYFGNWATPEEKLDVFRMIDTEGTGVITYGAFQTFQKDHENGSKPADSKVGCPDFLEYCGLLNGVRLACERDTFMERFRLAGQPLPPTPDWLLRTMEKEWMGAAKLYVHWQYVIAPVPGHQAGRRFPDWNGGFSVRDQGHEGMTVEDFMNTPEALAADLSAPEVVGLRLYTGPGYEPLNRSLRANSGRFTVTQFCIDSAVGKLARCASGSEILLAGPPEADEPALGAAVWDLPGDQPPAARPQRPGVRQHNHRCRDRYRSRLRWSCCVFAVLSPPSTCQPTGGVHCQRS